MAKKMMAKVDPELANYAWITDDGSESFTKTTTHYLPPISRGWPCVTVKKTIKSTVTQLSGPFGCTRSLIDQIRHLSVGNRCVTDLNLVDTLNICGGAITAKSWNEILPHVISVRWPAVLCMKFHDNHPDSLPRLMNTLISDRRVADCTTVVYASLPIESLVVIKARLNHFGSDQKTPRRFSKAFLDPFVCEHLLKGIDDYALHVLNDCGLGLKSSKDTARDYSLLRELYDGVPINFHVCSKATGRQVFTYTVVVETSCHVSYPNM